MKTYAYARITLYEGARAFVKLPRSTTFILPVEFRSDPASAWSLIIVPQGLLTVGYPAEVRVALLVDWHAPRLFQVGEQFVCEALGQKVAEGTILSVQECSDEEYFETFQYPPKLN